jgi:hypothetical protein
MESKQQPSLSPSVAVNHASNQQPKLLNIEVTDENVALNLLVGFLELAQRRGSFGFDESTKILECIKKFQKSS